MLLLPARDYRFDLGIIEQPPTEFVDSPDARARIAALNDILLSFDDFIRREAERVSAEFQGRLAASDPWLRDFDIETVARFSLRDDDPNYDDGEDMTITELRGGGRCPDQREGWDQEHIRGLASLQPPVLDAIGEAPVAQLLHCLLEYGHLWPEHIVRIGHVSVDVHGIAQRWIDV